MLSEEKLEKRNSQKSQVALDQTNETKESEHLNEGNFFSFMLAVTPR